MILLMNETLTWILTNFGVFIASLVLCCSWTLLIYRIGEYSGRRQMIEMYKRLFKQEVERDNAQRQAAVSRSALAHKSNPGLRLL